MTQNAPATGSLPTYPISKALRDIVRDPVGTTARIGAMGSPIVVTHLGPIRTWFICDGDLARQVLLTDSGSYERPALMLKRLGDAGGLNLFTSTGNEWRNRRRLLQPQFSRGHLDELADSMLVTIVDEVEGWRPGRTVDMQQRMADLTLRVTAQALVGIDSGTHELGALLRDKYGSIVEWVNHRLYHLASPPAVVPTRRNRKMVRDRSLLRAAIGRLATQRRKVGARSGNMYGPG